MLDSECRTVALAAGKLGELTPGRTGNLSVRRDEHMAITPSGVPYGELTPEDVAVVSLDGTQTVGDRPASSELPLHRHIYERFEAGAIAHVHSPWATTLAVLREPIPPVHYMIALAGESVPVAEYATFGTEELAARAVEAMEDAESGACLLANHGLVATGDDAASAVETAEAIESVAQVYCQARAFGTPGRLSDEEIQRVARKLEEYAEDPRGAGEG